MNQTISEEEEARHIKPDIAEVHSVTKTDESDRCKKEQIYLRVSYTDETQENSAQATSKRERQEQKQHGLKEYKRQEKAEIDRCA